MTKPDRSAERARKRFAHSVAMAADAKAERHSAKRVAKAERRERASRRAYLDAIRGAEAWEA